MGPSKFTQETSFKAEVDAFLDGLFKLHETVMMMSVAASSMKGVTVLLDPIVFRDVVFRLQVELDFGRRSDMDLHNACHTGEFRFYAVTVKEKRDASKWTSPPHFVDPDLSDHGTSG